MPRLLDVRIFWKIFLALLFVGLLSTSLFSVVMYVVARRDIETEAIKKLTAIREVKAGEVEHEFSEIRKQIAAFAEDYMVVEAMLEFKQAFAELEKEAQADPGLVEQARLDLRDFQKRKFLPQLNANSEAAYSAEDIMPQNPAAILLQSRYIVQNPNPVGSKQYYDRASDGSRYTKVHGHYHPVFRRYQDKFKYHDIFLVDPATGNIVYSVQKEPDLATSLHESFHLHTNFAEVFKRAVLTTEKDFQYLVDFQNYWASYNVPAAFIAAPIFDGEKKIGIVAFQMPVTRINNIMTNYGRWRDAGMGYSGQVYLVGRDQKLRSQSRFFLEDKAAYLKALRQANIVSEFICNKIDNLNTVIGLQTVRSKGVEAAFRQGSGQGVFADYRGQTVLSSYRPLDILNVDWVIMSEIDQAEALATLEKMRLLILFCFTGLLLMVGIFARFVSKFIADPLVGLSELMAKVESTGDLALRLERYHQDEVGKTVRNFHVLLFRWSNILLEVQGNTKLLLTEGRWPDNAELRPLTENDFLGNALVEITTALRRFYAENNMKNWLNSGQGRLNERMRGEQAPQALGYGILEFMAHYLNAQLGLFYMAGPDGVSLLASYALPGENFLTSFRPGEGVVGQAMVEKKMILLTSVAKDYLPVQSGLGHSPPNNIMVMPLVFNGQVQGVIELGTLESFTELQIDFMNLAAESIAIALAAANSRLKNIELLEQTRVQAEKLQNQTEELQNQTAELEAQQEQLKMVNKELEERAALLEKQKLEITEKNMKAEEARNLLEIKAAQLEESNRYKSEFLANMSHELRTPMNSIMVLSQTLIDSAGGVIPDKQKKYLRTIHDAGQGLLTIINDILDMSKMQAGKIEARLEDVDLREIVDSVDSMFRPMAEKKGLDLRIQVGRDLPALHSDQQRLLQILRNLLGNAIKFTEKGHVGLRISRPVEGRRMQGRLYNPTDLLIFVVEDSGIGIAPEKQERIFEAFQQQDGSTSRIYGGTGLGLTISRELSILLGGHLELESVPGEGAAFTLVLPVELPREGIPQPAPVAEAADSSLTPPGLATDLSPAKAGADPAEIGPDQPMAEAENVWLELAGKTLLVADDDPRNVYSLAALVEPIGLELLVAENGREAIARLREGRRVDAILMDIMMPEMDGYETMKKIRGMPGFKHIPIIVLTAKVMPEERERCLAAGASDYLSKPIVREKLFNTLKMWLHQGS